MAFPPITNLPAAPSRDQTPENFSSTADAFVAALPEFVTDVNAAGDYIDTKTVSVGNDFQGNYAAGTTYTTGQSVLYTDAAYYISLVDNNTGNAPDVSTSQWAVIGAGGGGGGRAIGELQYFSGAETVDYPGDGWLKCDGTSYTQASYPELHTTIGNIINGITQGNNSSGLASGDILDYAYNSVQYFGSYWYMSIGNYLVTTNDWTNFNVTNTGQSSVEQFITDGTYVAMVRDSQIYYTSDNGVTWTNYYPSGTVYGIKQLSYVSGVWVGRSWYTYVYYNSNITVDSWSQTTLGWNSQVWRGISSNGSWIVAGDNGGRWIYSNNGTSWSEDPFGADVYGATVLANNTSAGYNGTKIWYGSSPNAMSSNQFVTAPFTIYRFGKVGGDTFYATGRFGELITSTNGSTWTSPVISGVGYIGLAEQRSGIIDTDGSKYYAPSNGWGIVESTTFGTSWTSEANTLRANTDYRSIIHDGTKFVGFAVSGESLGQSTDGLTWSGISHNLPSQAFRSIAYDSTNYIAGGDAGSLVTSTNLTSWTSLTSGTSEAIRHVNYLDGTYLYITSSGTVATTTNIASAFTQRTTGIASSSQCSSASNGSRIIITSSTTTSYSDDGGLTWTLGGTTAGPIYSNVIWDGSKFIAAGYTGSSTGAIFTSTDGTSWATAYSTASNNTAFHSLVYYNGVYVASDSVANLYQSSDGNSWERLAAGSTFNGPLISDNSSKILCVNGVGYTIPLYTYNTASNFVVPTQTSVPSNGTVQLYIKAE